MKQIAPLLIIVFILLTAANASGQDSQAIKIADQVMESMGGADNWQNTRNIQWTFFGSRKWWWDKWTGDVRMESQRNDLRIVMNINDRTGQVYVHGTVQSHADSLKHYLERGYRMWVNDSYWLVMPFKLRDPGTHLRYLGRGQTLDDQPADILELTFAEVGVTPDNKYHIYVDPDRKLVVQWDYFRNAEDPEPRIRNLWTNYRTYGKILLSDGRGDRGMSDLAVFDQLPAPLFNKVEKTAAELLW